MIIKISAEYGEIRQIEGAVMIVTRNHIFDHNFNIIYTDKYDGYGPVSQPHRLISSMFFKLQFSGQWVKIQDDVLWIRTDLKNEYRFGLIGNYDYTSALENSRRYHYDCVRTSKIIITKVPRLICDVPTEVLRRQFDKSIWLWYLFDCHDVIKEVIILILELTRFDRSWYEGKESGR